MYGGGRWGFGFITFPRRIVVKILNPLGSLTLRLYADWFEGAVAQPQIVLQEMLGIVNPSFTHQQYFFRNVAKVCGSAMHVDPYPTTLHPYSQRYSRQ